LKIDREIIKPIIASPSQRRLVSSIIEIGRSQNIDIVAEGVETMEHAKILKDLGCHLLQGYALARPMTSEQLIEFCRAKDEGLTAAG
jgi:EAL domain-containing protein (putative c-di-GMP-specific phosphodiesterase class I)